MIWQDPIPAVDHALVNEQNVAALKAKLLASGLSISQLVTTAWACASTFCGRDKRGGANGARIRLTPQKDWEVNQPAELAKALKALEGVQKDCIGAQSGGKKVPFAPGRMDASQAQTDVDSFAALEPTADGFCNYLRKGHAPFAAELLVDQANLLTLTAPEMTVLVGGMRPRRSLCVRRRAASLCARLCNRVEQGDEPGPFRPGVMAQKGLDPRRYPTTAGLKDLFTSYAHYLAGRCSAQMRQIHLATLGLSESLLRIRMV